MKGGLRGGNRGTNGQGNNGGYGGDSDHGDNRRSNGGGQSAYNRGDKAITSLDEEDLNMRASTDIYGRPLKKDS